MKNEGVSLLEVIVVLLIITIIVSLSMPYVKQSRTDNLHIISEKIIFSIKRYRSISILEQKEIDVIISNEKSKANNNNGEKFIYISENIDASVTSATVLYNIQSYPVIRFFPDGSSSGGIITLKKRNDKIDIFVDWFSGGVRRLYEGNNSSR